MAISNAPTSNIAEYSVAELSQAVKRSIEDTFSFVRVRGELGRVSRPGSGHIYLDLKDDRAVLSGVIWKGNASRLQIQPEQGLEVIATGRLTTFPGQSRYQIVIEALEPAGQGALMALLEARKKKLAAEGLFAPERKQAIPYLPRVIGVVTSPTGAVIRDIMHRLNDRFPTHVLVWPVRVQGEKSAEEVAAAIDGFNGIEPGGSVPRPDLLIVARGGGSLEDLWSFNEEQVARAAAESEIPLISAVGHETDWTLIDYVADERAPTPTAAAERAVPVRSDLLAAIDDHARRLRMAGARGLEARRAALRSAERGLPRLQDLLALPRQRLDFAATGLLRALHSSTRSRRSTLDGASARLRPALLVATLRDRAAALDRAGDRLARGLGDRATAARARLERQAAALAGIALPGRVRMARASLDAAFARLHPALANRVLRKADRLAAQASLLDAYSHQGVLARGFALVRDASGGLVRTAKAATDARSVSLQFADAAVDATIGDSPRPVRPKAPQKPKVAKPKPAQTSFFDEG